MHKKLLFALLTLVLFIVCGILIYEEKQQFDYLYLNGNYYALTGEDLASQGRARGEPLGQIQRNARISSHQQDGDSNVLPVGTIIYAVDASGLTDLDGLHYSYTLAYPDDGVYCVARLYVSDIADWNPVQSS